MAFSQLWQKFFSLYIHLKSFDEPFCPRNPDSECRIVADVAGLALFTQIQLVLRLPRHRRIDHNLGNTGNVRIHKSGNIQIWDSEDQPNPNSTSPLPPMHGVENSLIISFLAINKKNQRLFRSLKNRCLKPNDFGELVILSKFIIKLFEVTKIGIHYTLCSFT